MTATSTPAHEAVRPVAVGFDGSAESLTATGWAGREAALRGVPLRIVHAMEWRTSNQQFSLGASAQREWVESRIEVAQEELSEAHPGLAISVERVPDLPAKVLVDAARESEVLVLGSRGLGVLQGFLLGSVSLSVIAHASRPVVMAHEPEESSGSGPVVVGLGHGEDYGPLLDFAFGAADRRGVALRVVQVRDRADGAEERAPREGCALADALHPYRERWPALEVSEWLSTGSAAQLLLEAAADATLLVVGRGRRKPAYGVRIGPVTHAVLHHAPCPVAVVPHD